MFGAPLTTPVDFDPFADPAAATRLPLTASRREMRTAVQMGDPQAGPRNAEPIPMRA